MRVNINFNEWRTIFQTKIGRIAPAKKLNPQQQTLRVPTQFASGTEPALEVSHSLRLFYGPRNGWRQIELPEFVAGELGGVHCSANASEVFGSQTAV